MVSGEPAEPADSIMWRDQPFPTRVHSAGTRRAVGKPLTVWQERLFLYTVFAIGIALQLAAALKLLPFLT